MDVKGDGTDLCCMIHPIYRHINCGVGLCGDHFWNTCRERIGLLSTDKAFAICPRCGKEGYAYVHWEHV